MKRSLRPDIAAAEAAARAGEELREARLALGLSVEAVAERLRIRRPYLLALEEGRWDDLPGGAYAIGFLRSYAQGLGLDGEAMVRRLRDSGAAAAATRRTDLVFPEPIPERGVPTGIVVLAGAIVTIGAYAAWYNWSGSGERVVDSVPPLPSRLEEVVRAERIPAAPAAGPPGQGHASAPPAPAAPAAVAGVAGPGGGGVPTGPAAPAAAAPPPPTQALAATVAAPAAASASGGGAAPPAPSVVPAAAPAAEEPPSAERIVLRARAETWVSVREARGGGPPLLNRILRPGESFAVPPREGLVLSVGRADALEVLVDGEPAPVLDGLRGRRMNIPLDAERLKAANRATPPQGGAAEALQPAAAASR